LDFNEVILSIERSINTDVLKRRKRRAVDYALKMRKNVMVIVQLVQKWR